MTTGFESNGWCWTLTQTIGLLKFDFPLHDCAWRRGILVFTNICTSAHTSATTTTISPYITLWPSTRYITIWRYCWHTKVIAFKSDIDNSYSFLFCRLRLDDLNARDSSTSFAVYFFLDLFRTATHHSDFHRVFLLVICLVLDFSCSLINIIKSTKLSHFLW